MKKIIFSLIALTSVSLFTATTALADTTVGVINMQNLLQKLPQMKQIGDDLKKQFSDKQKQLLAAQDSFKADAEKFRRDNSVMTAKDRQATEEKLFKQQQDLQKTQAELQHDYMDVQNKQVDALMNKVKDAVEVIATENKFDLILINASVAYAKKDMDITDKVLTKMGSK